MRLTNDFSWSFSRANTFSECQKRYWYTYYGSWEGWPKTPYDKRPSIDPLAAYLYALKQMQSIWAFVGSAVHNTIEHFLKLKKPIELSELIEHADKAFLKGIDEAKNETWRISPKKHTSLFEYYYKVPPTEAELAEAKAKIHTSLVNWHSSNIVQELLFHKQAYQVSVEELASFQLQERFKIIVVMDLALSWKKSDGSHTYILFDWKTGEESEKTEKQLYCYALFANRVWNVPLDHIILVPFYLFKNSYQKIQNLDPVKLQEAENEIEASCTTLLPLHQKEVEHFAYTEDRTKCRRCPFKELCTKAEYKNITREELATLIPI
jgi:hypothetical protein